MPKGDPTVYFYDDEEPLVWSVGKLLRQRRPDGVNREDLITIVMDMYRLLRTFHTMEETVVMMGNAVSHMEDKLQSGVGGLDDEGKELPPILAEHWRDGGEDALQALLDFTIPDTLEGIDDELEG